MESSSSSSSPSSLPSTSTSFEAFHTKQLRQRAREKYEQQLHKDEDDDDVVGAGGGTPMMTIPGCWPCVSWSRTQIGETLERLEVQSTIVFLIYVDWLVFTLYYIHDMETTCSIFGITGDGDGDGDGDGAGVGAGMNGGDGILLGNHGHGNGILVSKFLASVLNFNMMVFVLEAMFIMYAFGMQCLEHYGYMLDIVLLFAIVYHDLFELDFGIGGGIGGIIGVGGGGSPLRFLTLLRVWRMARITSTTLQLQKVKHDDTKEELTALQSKMDRTLLDVKRLKANCTTEGDLRKQVERMLEEYRGEIGVMKEALQIAAMDVVKVAAASAAADADADGSSGIDIDGVVVGGGGSVVVVGGGGGEEATRRSGRSRSRDTMMDVVEGDAFYDGAE